MTPNSTEDRVALVERLRAPLVIGYAVPGPVFETLQQAADERGEAADLIEALTRTDNDVSGLVEALEFYRDEWRKNQDAARGIGLSAPDMLPTHALLCDYGARAIAALAKHRQSNGGASTEQQAPWTKSGKPWVHGLARTDGPPLPTGEVNLETGERRQLDNIRFRMVPCGHVRPEELDELRALHGFDRQSNGGDA